LLKADSNTMDIQATKLELMRLLLNTQKVHVLEKVKEILEKEKGADFWDELDAEDQAAVNEGLDQVEKGQYVSHESVREDIKKRFNF